MNSDKIRRGWAFKLAGVSILFISLFVACVPPAGPTPVTPPAAKPCNGNPNIKPCYLAKKGIGSHQESIDYYRTIDPTGAYKTFSEWLRLNGFKPDGSGDVRAVYYNEYDLNLGRDMNCRKTSFGIIACYVTNYGPDPADAASWFLQPNANKALGDATNAFNMVSGSPHSRR